jgi:hypothetical protein
LELAYEEVERLVEELSSSQGGSEDG